MATAIIESYTHCSPPNYSHSMHLPSSCQFRTPPLPISTSVSPYRNTRVLSRVTTFTSAFLFLPSCLYISIISSILSSHILTHFCTLLSQCCTLRPSLVAARGWRFLSWAIFIRFSLNKWVIFNAVYPAITYNRQIVKICYSSGDKVVSIHAMKIRYMVWRYSSTHSSLGCR